MQGKSNGLSGSPCKPETKNSQIFDSLRKELYLNSIFNSSWRFLVRRHKTLRSRAQIFSCRLVDLVKLLDAGVSRPPLLFTPHYRTRLLRVLSDSHLLIVVIVLLFKIVPATLQAQTVRAWRRPVWYDRFQHHLYTESTIKSQWVLVFHAATCYKDG